MPESRKRQPKSRPVRPSAPGRTTAAPGKELKPWQLAAFILAGLAVAGIFLGVGFVKKSHDEYGQWPWARSAIPPKMYYDKRHFKDPTTTSLPDPKVKIGKTPGGGVIYTTTAPGKYVPTVIWVENPASHEVKRFSLSGGP